MIQSLGKINSSSTKHISPVRHNPESSPAARQPAGGSHLPMVFRRADGESGDGAGWRIRRYVYRHLLGFLLVFLLGFWGLILATWPMKSLLGTWK